MPLLLQFFAFLCLACGVHVGQGLYTPSAIPFLLGAVMLAFASLIPTLQRVSHVRNLSRWLGAGVCLNLVLLLSAPPAKHLQLERPSDVVWFFVLLIPSVLTFWLGFIDSQRTSRSTTPDPAGPDSQFRFARYQPLLLILTWSLPIVWVILHAPRPQIDVFNLQSESAHAWVGGINPYAMTFEDMYHGNPKTLGPGISVHGVIVYGYPYLPESLYLATVGEILAGDHRVAHLGTMMLTAGLLVGIGRASGASSRVIVGTCGLFLFMPTNAHVIESSWTEPLIGLTLAACVYAGLRRSAWLPVMVGLFLASKQYTFIYLPATWLLLGPGVTWKSASKFYGISLLTALLVTLPLVLWDPQAFWRSAFERHTLAPFRADALTFQSWLAGVGIHVPRASSFAALVPVVFLILRFGRRTPAGFATAVGATTVVFFAFSHQAFVNYYLPAFAAWACAIVASPATTFRPGIFQNRVSDALLETPLRPSAGMLN